MATVSPRATRAASVLPVVRRRRRFPFVRWTLFAAVVGLLSFIAGLLVAPIDLTVAPPLRAALLLDSSGRYLTSIRAPEYREEISGDKIHERMRQAIIAAEDERYFSHQGVDPLAIVRAAYQDIFHDARQGGSTITQQYVKNVYVGNKRTFLRKVREAALAIRAEHKFGKPEILNRYLNTLYLGNGTYGVQAAASYYYGVAAADLDLDLKTRRRSDILAIARATMLAGIAPAPSAWNPVKNPAAAKTRQLYALNQMVANRMISPEQASRAYTVPIEPVEKRPPQDPTPAPVFTDMVTQELKETVGDDQLFRGGLRVRTTLDLLMQKAVDEAVREVLPDPDDPDAAVVVLDPASGDLKAIHSSRYVPVAKKGGFNLATQARRTPGSTMKPFALAAALMKGQKTTDVYPAPSCLRVRGYPRPLCNNEGSGGGSMTLHRALVRSVNTVFLRLAQKVGTQSIRDVAQAAGLDGRIDTGLSMVLGGGVEVSPLSMAEGYSTIAAGGLRRPSRLVLHVKANGGSDRTFSGVDIQPPEPARPPGQRVMPKAVADEISTILTEAVERGTGRAARQEFTVFGKTGTANDYTDAWFVGCGNGLCIATWLGYSKQLRSMRNVQGVARVLGGTLPAKIFDQFWEKLEAARAAERASEEGASSPAPSVSPTRSRRPRTPAATTPVRPSPSPVPSPTPSPSASSGASPSPTVEPTVAPSSPDPSGEPSPTTGPDAPPTGGPGGGPSGGPGGPSP